MRGSIEDGFYVENLYQTYIETIEELLVILEEGQSSQRTITSIKRERTNVVGELNRATAGHALNDTSSRSHALLSIQIEQDIPNEQNPQEQMTRQGKLTFVDLAGEVSIVMNETHHR